MTDVHLLATPQQFGDYGLGRLYLPDERDQQFLMTSFLAPPEALVLPRYKYYTTGPVLDQGRSPQCVDYSENQWLATSPIRNTRYKPGVIYCEAQKRDPWEGDCTNPKYDGTSVRAGMKFLQEQGRVQTYVWAFDAQTVANWILSGKGPVVVGTAWYRSMFNPNPKTGLITLDRSSPLDGGHAYLLSGYNAVTRLFRITNSWGTRWGQGGRAWIRFEDMDSLIKEQGEACTAVEVRSV